MEKTFLKKRKAIRAAFTKIHDELETMLGSEAPPQRGDVSARFAMLEIKFASLTELDEQILDILSGKDGEDAEEKIDKDLESSDRYNLNYFKLKEKIDSVLKRDETASVSSCASVQNARLNLPKLELVQFNGEISEWLNFWAQFSEIDRREDLSDQLKFQYLRQATVAGSRARTVVDSFPSSSENYSKAIDALKSRFGRKDLLVEHYIRELLKLVSGKSSIELSVLYDKLETQLRALETLEIVSENYAAILFPLVESCIPFEVLKIWQRSNTDASASLKDQMESLLKFLKSEVQAEERAVMARHDSSEDSKKATKSNKSLHTKKEEPRATAADLANVDTSDLCVFCGKRHASSDCWKLSSMTADSRKQAIFEAKACFKCAKRGHRAKWCKVKCDLCKGKHAKFLCENSEKSSVVKEVKGSSNKESDLLTINHSLSVGASEVKEVYLQTFSAILYNDQSQRKVRVLIDCGSQRSYVLNVIAKELYEPIGEESLVHSVFGGQSLGLIRHETFKIRMKSLKNEYACNFSALGQANIAAFVPRFRMDRGTQEELGKSKINLMEDKEGPIDVLIGADIAGKLWTGKQVVLSSGMVSIQTLFGWTLFGRDNRRTESTSSSLALTYTMATVATMDLSDMWKLETIGICDPAEKENLTARRAATMNHFKDTVEFVNGRYRVRLPWTEIKGDLPTNREMAEARLNQVLKRMKRNVKLFEDYDAVLREWLYLGIIEEVQGESDSDGGHFLPHRPVVKESSLTTKIRPVFDASAKSYRQPSLNDCLEAGPNMIELIPDVLKRFRDKKIGITADIEKAFLMIEIHPEDRKFLKFLWWDSQREQRVTYQHERVVFGVTCSPFLLAAVLEHHLDGCISAETTESTKRLLQILKRCMYVDNLATSLNTLDEVCDFQSLATSCLATGGFNLRGWEYTQDNKADPETKILGLKWNRHEDSLSVNMEWWDKWEKTDVFTKRSVYSMTQRIYDPIGFCAPFLLKLKLLLQELWIKKLDWDDLLEENDKKAFEDLLKGVSSLKEVAVPRCLGGTLNRSLHLFSDASARSYAACVFLRSESEDGTVLVNLIEARTRITGIKDRPTMPRLELMGMVIGVRLLRSIQEALDLEALPAYAWTDSSTVLAWIKRDIEWSVFVRNRVKEIRNLVPHVNWRHVPGELNPADLPSRGCTAEQLVRSAWWEGPLWLKANEEEWPVSPCTYKEEEVSREMIKGKRQEVKTLVTSCISHSWLYQYFSKFEKIVRMVGWMLRFRHSAFKEKELTTEELREAEIVVWRLVQEESFSSLSDSRICHLRPFKDESGLLRIRTKLTEREDVDFFKTPILLPYDHPVVKRMIYDLHCRESHVGAQTLWSMLREKFWVVKGRQQTRNVVRKCVTCRRFTSKCFDVESPPLPQSRVSDAAVFEVCGVDYAGPLNLYDGQKVWMALFTCGVYRAVHLEIVTSLSTEAFLLALRRFIARRGRPKIIYSDNGTCFQGAERAFGKLDWSEVREFCSIERIDWRFNPPTAAWWGGFFERMIQSVKRMLRRVLGKASLSLEELFTMVCEIESLVNARPITYSSESNNDPVALTPATFLMDGRGTEVVDCEKIDENSLQRRLRYRQSIKKQLRKRFRTEYLGNLKWELRRNTREPTVGEVVLIEPENAKRIDWPLARVADVVRGRDGKIRVLRLQTATKTLIRPLQRVYPLEVEGSPTSMEEKDS